MYFKRRLYKPSNSIFIWLFPYRNYLDQSTNQNDGLAGRCQESITYVHFFHCRICRPSKWRRDSSKTSRCHLRTNICCHWRHPSFISIISQWNLCWTVGIDTHYRVTKNKPLGSKGRAVVRALASHQCGPGSNPGVDAICGLSLLLVLSLAPRGFSPGTPVFPSPQKPTFPNSRSTRNQVDEEPLCGCATYKSLFIISWSGDQLLVNTKTIRFWKFC